MLKGLAPVGSSTPRHGPTAGSYGVVVVSYTRGTPVCFMKYSVYRIYSALAHGRTPRRPLSPSSAYGIYLTVHCIICIQCVAWVPVGSSTPVTRRARSSIGTSQLADSKLITRVPEKKSSFFFHLGVWYKFVLFWIQKSVNPHLWGRRRP